MGSASFITSLYLALWGKRGAHLPVCSVTILPLRNAWGCEKKVLTFGGMLKVSGRLPSIQEALKMVIFFMNDRLPDILLELILFILRMRENWNRVEFLFCFF